VVAASIESPAKPFREALVAFWKATNRSHGSLLQVWEPPSAGSSYLMSVDSASGKSSGDWLVAPVFDRKTKRQVAVLRAQVPTSEFARWAHALAKAYGNAVIVVERNNHGHTVVHVLDEELHYRYLWRDERQEIGFWTGAHNRQPIIDDLVDAVQLGEFVTRDRMFVTEARTFVRTASGKVEAQPGCHDDVILATAIAWRVLTGPVTDRQDRMTTQANKLSQFG
jgi:hypothetical protein